MLKVDTIRKSKSVEAVSAARDRKPTNSVIQPDGCPEHTRNDESLSKYFDNLFDQLCNKETVS